jgi:hypothetical protein
MRRIVSGLFVALLGIAALGAPAAAQTTTTNGYPPQATTAPQATAQVAGVSVTRPAEPEPPVAVGGIVLTRDAAGTGPVSSALARTGSDAAALTRAALVAIAVGGAAVLATRRRPAR